MVELLVAPVVYCAWNTDGLGLFVSQSLDPQTRACIILTWEEVNSKILIPKFRRSSENRSRKKYQNGKRESRFPHFSLWLVMVLCLPLAMNKRKGVYPTADLDSHWRLLLPEWAHKTIMPSHCTASGERQRSPQSASANRTSAGHCVYLSIGWQRRSSDFFLWSPQQLLWGWRSIKKFQFKSNWSKTPTLQIFSKLSTFD